MEKGSFRNMKRKNKKNIFSLIKNEKDISRAEIAEKLDISRATVTNIVRELIAKKLVKESQIGKSSGGRRPMLLKLNPEAAYGVGLEWGIESIKAVLLNLEGKIIYQDKIELKKHSLAEYLQKTFELINNYKNKLKKPAKIAGIALGIHGLVDPASGSSLFTPHFNWGEVNIKNIFENEFEAAVYIDNDVRMMSLGEISQGREDFIFINTGSGIGAALVFKSKLYYGSSSAAGELGHLKIADDSPRCSCGKKGCLEALASKESILTRYHKLKAEQNISFSEIMNNYKKNEKEALLVINDALKYFARAISDLVNILNPEAVVIGGLFARYESLILKKIYQIVKEESLAEAVADLKITTAYHQQFAGACGAAEKVLNNFYEFEI